MRARLVTFALWIVAAAVAVVLGGYVWLKNTVIMPGPLTATTTVVVAPGAGLSTVARQLADAHVVADAWMFELEARRTGQMRALKPGEYRFEPPISLADALSKIVRRDVVIHRVTIPEGLTTGEIHSLVDATQGLSGAIAAKIDEGDLLPETYSFELGDSRDALISRMKSARKNLLDELWLSRAADLPFDTPEQAVVLASIVEKETGVAGERPRIATVFINRLKRGMRLQSDPTVIYGLSPSNGDLDRQLTRNDLEAPTPYNTYVNAGLPLGPICNPGRAAIAAVLNPAPGDELYFVADGSGGHAFAATLAEHNRNVSRWRVIQRGNSGG